MRLFRTLKTRCAISLTSFEFEVLFWQSLHSQMCLRTDDSPTSPEISLVGVFELATVAAVNEIAADDVHRSFEAVWKGATG